MPRGAEKRQVSPSRLGLGRLAVAIVAVSLIVGACSSSDTAESLEDEAVLVSDDDGTTAFDPSGLSDRLAQTESMVDLDPADDQAAYDAIVSSPMERGRRA